MQHAKTEDYIRNGMIRELMGRLHIRTSFDGLTGDDLADILRTTHVEEERASCELFGIDLVVSDEAVAAISKNAAEDGTGARGLKGVLENIVGPIKYEQGGMNKEGEGLLKVVVDENMCLSAMR